MTPRALIAAVIAMLGAAAVAVAVKNPKSHQNRCARTQASFSASVLVARNRRVCGVDVPHRREPRYVTQNRVCIARICRTRGICYSPAASSPGYRHRPSVELGRHALGGIGCLQPLSDGPEVSVGWHVGFVAVSLSNDFAADRLLGEGIALEAKVVWPIVFVR